MARRSALLRYFLPLKPPFLPAIRVFVVIDLGEKHLHRPHPDAALAVERAIDDHVRLRLRIPGEIQDLIAVALEVAHDVAGLHALRHSLPSSPRIRDRLMIRLIIGANVASSSMPISFWILPRR